MANRPRVAHLTTVHHPLDPRIYRKEARTLSAAGFDVWLLTRPDGRSDLEGVRFVPLADGSGNAARMRRQVDAWKELRQIEPDLLHIHDPELIPLAWRLKSASGVKGIYDKHEDYEARLGISGKAIRKLEAWALQWVDHVIVAEDAYRKSIEGAGAACTVVLNYALPPSEPIDPVDQTINSPSRLVYTGTVSEGRGLFRMLDLARLIRERGLGFTIEIAGICNYPEQRRMAERRIKSEQLSDVVAIAGWDRFAETVEIERALRRADVGLMLAEPDPNYVVSIPTKFYEYLQYGLPMVVSDIPLWSNFIAHTQVGVVVPYDDPDLILRELSGLQDRDVYMRYRRTSLARAEAFQWKNMEGRLLEAYATTLGNTVSRE